MQKPLKLVRFVMPIPRMDLRDIRVRDGGVVQRVNRDVCLARLSGWQFSVRVWLWHCDYPDCSDASAPYCAESLVGFAVRDGHFGVCGLGVEEDD